ncbi:TerD family protein [Streptomyces sp. NK08204]|uniref:TerD family protein n=1 Tax=Streptomyces sp. NK08204 TaxID=2873260 RepID=UPI001CECBDCF|nr:TerD family protein [Streptomyces sp. NK08204]
MSHIAKGANTPVPAAPLRIAVGRSAVPGTPAVDASALLLDATGRVRGDADLVFHNQPAHPSGAVRHAGVGQGGGQFAEWLELDLPHVEAVVQRVVIAGSCEGGTFGQVPGLYVQAVARDGRIVAHFEVTDASSETAFVLGEFYRRDGAWKFRAVGQGYDSGLAGLATDYGIVVAEQTPAPSPAGPAAPPVAQPVSGPVPLKGVSKVGSAPAVPATSTAGPAMPATSVTGSAVPTASVAGPAVPAAWADAPVPSTGSPWGPSFFDFEPYVHSGTGSTKITMDIPFPPDSGPVIMEARVEKYKWIQVQIPGRDDTVFCHDLPEHHGRVLLVPPRKGGPLRLKVSCSGDWTLTVLPLSAARPIGTGTVQGSGPEVLLHTGGTADLKIRAKDPDNGRFQLNCHKGDTPDELRRAEELHSAWNGRRVRATVRIPDGPLLLAIDRSRHHWELTATPLPVRDPSAGHKSGVYQGRGEKTITLINPRPGRPALVRYDFPGAGADYRLEVKTVDEYGDEGDWLDGVTDGTRGVTVAFRAGQAEQTVRVRHTGEWTLRLLSEDEAPLLTGPAEGKGSTVLRYQGPPTLMTVRRTSLGKDEKLAVFALNHPYGKWAIVADTNRRRRPVLGPVWVDPGGSCFVVVKAVEGTKWRLEPEPLSAAPVLGARTHGGWYGVVRHTGPECELVIAGASSMIHVFELDENLFPYRKLTASSGPYRISSSFLHVRSLGEWTLELRD